MTTGRSGGLITASLFLVGFYLTLFLTLLTRSAVLLVVLLPLGLLFLIASVFIWFVAVFREAKAKDLI